MIDSQVTRRTALTLFAASPLFASRGTNKEDTMFLALNSVLLSGRVKWPEFAHVAATAGFPGTDIMLDQAMKEGAEATNQLLSKLAIKPAIIDFPVEFRKDDATFEASLTRLDEAARFAVDIHCPRMITWIMSSSDTPKADLRETYKRRFTKSAEILAKHNVRLGLEFLGPLELRKKFKYEFIWKMNEMLEFTKECGPNVGLLLDAWHWHWAGASTDDIVSAGRDRIVHIHFDDAPNLPPDQIHDDHRLLPGEGVINLVGFLKALDQIGYKDALSVEVFGRLKDVPPEKAAKMGYDASAAVFRKAGVAEASSPRAR